VSFLKRVQNSIKPSEVLHAGGMLLRGVPGVLRYRLEQTMNTERGQIEIRYLNGVYIDQAQHRSQLVSTCQDQQDVLHASWDEDVLNLPLCAHFVGSNSCSSG